MASETTTNIEPIGATPEQRQALLEDQQKSIPVLPVRDTVLFPHAVLPLTVGRESSIQLIHWEKRKLSWLWRSGKPA
jgi:ATP-dependent Lon protease